VVQILGRRTKNNPCLIGEPGVGKTAIAEGLAQRISTGDVPETIEGKKVYFLHHLKAIMQYISIYL
jgi:ATP-dependent Clp protease ATP-binding subunit ClpC